MMMSDVKCVDGCLESVGGPWGDLVFDVSLDVRKVCCRW